LVSAPSLKRAEKRRDREHKLEEKLSQVVCAMAIKGSRTERGFFKLFREVKFLQPDFRIFTYKEFLNLSGFCMSKVKSGNPHWQKTNEEEVFTFCFLSPSALQN
jgi:hypothetical protein